MSKLMIAGVIAIFLALVFYSIAIFSEKYKGTLEKWMVVTFTIAFLFDLIGTGIMKIEATSKTLNFHAISGLFALALMGIHLAFAIISIKSNDKAKNMFHRFSIYAWIVWVISFISGSIHHY